MSATPYPATTSLSLAIEAGIARIALDNGPINLLDRTMFKELAALIPQLAADDSVRVLILHSRNPGFFIAHYDVELILRIPPDRVAPTDQLQPFHLLCESLRTMPKPTIAVIEGRAGGGGSEIALSCDMRFALRGRAVFNQPEVALGILPGGSGTVRLARLMGRSRALEAVLGCDDIDAATAEAWGWVNRALPQDELWPHVNRLAERIAGFPPHAVAAAKACVLKAEAGVRDDLLAEAAAFQATLAGPGTQSAMRRFLQLGGQTAEGEARLGELAGRLAAGAGSG